jgi:hypothetical protein
VVGPTFYGVSANRSVTAVNEATTVYTAGTTATTASGLSDLNVTVFPNPASDLIAIQLGGLVQEDLEVELIDQAGRVVKHAKINRGSTIAYFDVQTVYTGVYFVKLYSQRGSRAFKVILER